MGQSAPGSRAIAKILAAFALAVAVVMAAGWLLFDRQRDAVTEAELDELARITALKTRDVADWRMERLDDIGAVTRDDSFLDVLQRWMESGGSAAERYLREQLDVRLVTPRYEGVFILDPGGEPLLVVGARPDAPDLNDLAASVRNTGTAVFGDFIARDAAANAVRMLLLAPVPDPESGELTAIVGYRVNPYPYFRRMLASWPRPWPTSELLLVRRPDNAIVFAETLLAPTEAPRHGEALLRPGALVRSDGPVEGVDYRGEKVIAVVSPVPGTPWSIIAKVDEREILAPVREYAAITTGATVILIVIIGALVALWWRKEQLRYRMEVYEQTLRRQALARHFDYLAKYANDIILLADQRGHIVEANDRALEAYGRERRQLLGSGWDSLHGGGEDQEFSIRWQDTARSDAVVYESVHRRADGSTFPVEISARFIETNGRPFYQAIIRDITERKESERRILQLSQLYAALSQTSEAIVRYRDRDALLKEICRIAVEFGSLKVAWIGMLQADLPFLAPVASAGEIPNLLVGRRLSVAEALPEGRGPSGVAVREGVTVVSNDFLNDPNTEFWHEIAREHGIRSSAALPLRQRDRVVGTLSVYSGEAGYFTPEVVELFEEMALDISYALDNLEREEQRARAERTVKESEERYRQLFDNMSSGVAVYDARDGCERFLIAGANRALERIEKVDREAIIGRELSEVFPGADAFGIREALRRVCRSGEPEHMPIALYADQRLSGWRENYIYRLPTGEVVSIYDDVTERKRAEIALRENEERLSLVLEGSRDGFWDFDLVGNRVFYSDRWADMLGYRPDEIEQTRDAWERLVHPDDLPVASRLIEEHLAGRSELFEAEFRMRARNGDWRWILSRGRVVTRDAAGNPARLAGTHSDVTERRRAEEQLRLWAKVFANSGEAIFITDENRKIITANEAFYRTTGYTPGEALGRNPSMLSSHQHDQDFYRRMWASIDALGHWQGEILDRRKDGEVYPQWLAITAVKDPAGKISHYIAIFSDISERKEAEERIRYLAHHDFLTGLPNRTLLHDRLEHALAHAKRVGQRVAVLFMDLDRFKNVNDSLGHHRGDQLLKDVAVRLGGAVREDDTVCRMGGDEFIIAAGELVHTQDAMHVAQKLLEAVSRPYQLDGFEVHITPSIGVALYPDDGDDIDTLIRNADAAMYYAKEKGRNNFQFFMSELNVRAFKRLSLETNLRRGLDRGQFRLVYQPQIHAASGQVVGVEALIRWQRGGGEVMLPNDFIPVAEESGLITDLGEWVVREACRQHGRWMRAGLKPISVAVNISAIQLHQKDFRERVSKVMLDTGTGAGALEFELTEGSIMQEAESTVRTLSELKAMGIALAIDDFGTGYSSLSYLRRFPIDRLKVDQSFVRDMSYNRADLEITSAIIALGRSLGLRVVAEGVETEKEFQLLREHLCDDIQGNYFSPPLTSDEFVAWMSEREEQARRGRAK